MSNAEVLRDGSRSGRSASRDEPGSGDVPARVRLRHRTCYAYDRPVWLSSHEIRLRPAAHTRTPVESYALKIAPANHDLKWQQDPHGNWVARVLFSSAVPELVLDVDLVARLTPVNPFDFYVDDSAWQFPFTYSPSHRHALGPYLELDSAGERMRAWTERMHTRLLARPLDTVELLVAVTRWVADDVRYARRLQPGIQTCEETLAAGSGSCRDSAWLLAQILRHTGIAARFVSGYLIQLGDGPPELGVGANGDSAALHAWCEAYVPGGGWIGLDSTSGLLAAEGHVPLACTARPADAGPVIGYAETSRSRLSVDMQVTRLASGMPFVVNR
jgi:transglutaminase-like putative cysteine protease